MDPKYDGQSVENVINMIKQKHFKDITVEDFAFLRAREAYLSEADKKIYLEGQDPKEVMQDHTALTAKERTINENRALQEENRKIADAQNHAAEVAKAAQLPAEGEARFEADEKLEEERSEKFESLNAEADALEKAAKEKEKKESKSKKDAKASDEAVEEVK